MIAFFSGVFIGTVAGIAIVCLLMVAKEADDGQI